MLDFAVTIDELPYCTIEGRCEVKLTGRPRRATWTDPAEDGEVELGTIEQIVSHTVNIRESRWNYAPFPSHELGKLLEQAVRDALECDPEFMASALTHALDQDAVDREDAMEWRAEQRREDRMMEDMR